ncbi:MAG TPA: hypothetical protein PLY42_11645 [Nitrospira sp.]|jgi:hypothetical protein|nr:hypothetical protein [Nitrospira sp.]HMX92015.1 hypothetical protein [Nitrospira sp.]HNG53727.1 hypothetical protein [Nitrospira sp.]HNN41547.1 hypothetical protein [Nitrospira sp.]
MAERLEMTVKMQVTPAQALALQAMFQHWNRLASWGSSRMIGFFVDGDGNFKPRCDIAFSEPLPVLTDELAKAAIASDDGHGTLNFDFDGVAWRLHDLPANAALTGRLEAQPEGGPG